ncbi:MULTISPECIES: DsbA family protein [Actinomyces]|uniref:Thioredoxin domain-containing protein n=1 Tax=Actinomyces marmotae TaxID=2737173 RepID=A0A6M8B718_9ACTO|nr:MULTISPECIES: thioredoxin domain-containing protein [Actinomyces]QKD80370.1 thioredoxin domain-containing protein [Actinomyces marmotae]
MASNDPRPTKAERREAARVKAQALREEQARKSHRAALTRRALIGTGAVAVVGGVAGTVWHAKSVEDAKKNSRLPSAVREDGSWTYGKDLAVGSSTADAPVLDVYFDYACHFCANFEVDHSEEMKKLASDGKITLALHPAQFLNQDWTNMAYHAMGAVLDNEPDKALDYHNALLARFGVAFSKKDKSLITKTAINEVASEAGLSSDTRSAIKKALKYSGYQKWIDASTKSFQDGGFRATPTILYDGKQVDLNLLQAKNSLADYVNGQQSGAAPATPTAAPATPTETPAPETPAASDEPAPEEGAATPGA